MEFYKRGQIMKIYCKLYVSEDENNFIIGHASSLQPYREPGTIAATYDVATKIHYGSSKLNNTPHYIVDQNGDCPLYNE